jgi:hypothetical protein
MSLVPGSYIPQFTPATQNSEVAGMGSHDPAQLAEPRMVAPTSLESHPGIEAATPETPRKHRLNRSYVIYAVVASALLFGMFGYRWLSSPNAQNLFWKPVLDTPGSVLLAVGDVPNGPPRCRYQPEIKNTQSLSFKKLLHRLCPLVTRLRLHVSSGHWSRREKTSSSGEKERVLSPICAKGQLFW